MMTWKVKNDRAVTPNATFDISGESLDEAVSQNAEIILSHTMPDSERLVVIEGVKVKWSDGIFGGKGGAVAEISVKISNSQLPKSPKYAERQKVYTAWIYADKEDSGYSFTIKQLRELSNMTQKEFAEYFNVSRRTIENWECGRTNPPNYLVELMEYKLKNEGILK